MDAKRELELAEVKEAIKKAEARLQMHEELKNLDMKLQDRLDELEKQKTCLIQQLGEGAQTSRVLAEDFQCHGMPCMAAMHGEIVTSPNKSWTSFKTIKRFPCMATLQEQEEDLVSQL